MRLKNSEIYSIKEAINNIDSQAKIYLFGSRTDDNRKGGDIDLLIISKKFTKDDKRQLRLDLYETLGEQKIDVIIAENTEDPFVRIALCTGIML